MIRKTWLIALALLFSFGIAQAQVFVYNDITTAEIWPREHYIIMNDITIYTSLSIQSGSTVSFAGDFSIYVDGGASFTAYRTTFTSLSGVPQAGDWGSIEFTWDNTNLSTGRFTYCEFYYGGDFENDITDLSGPMVVNNGDVNVVNCTFKHNLGSAVSVRDEFMSSLYMSGLLIEDCQIGVKLYSQVNGAGNLSSALVNSKIFDCDEFGIISHNLDPDVEIANNIVAYIEGEGAQFQTNYGILRNNTFAYCGGTELNFWGFGDPNANILKNTIIVDHDRADPNIISGQGALHTENLCVYNNQGNYTQGIINGMGTWIYTDPLFFDATVGYDNYDSDHNDFHLKWQSPCIDYDMDVQDEDRNGTPGDLGAYSGPGPWNSTGTSRLNYLYFLGITSDIEDIDWDQLAVSRYHVMGDLVVPAYDNLHIEPRVVGLSIYFKPGSSLNILCDGYINGADVGGIEMGSAGGQWDGIVIGNGSDTVMKMVRIEGASTGIMGLSATIYLTTISSKACDDFIYLHNCVSSYMEYCTAEGNNETGIIFENTSPAFYNNYTKYNGYAGMALYNSANVIIGRVGSTNNGNQFKYNGLEAFNDWDRAELYYSNSSPVISWCYNDFIDENDADGRLVYCDDPMITPIGGEGCYFRGEALNPNNWFYPAGLVTGQAQWATVPNITSLSYFLLKQAQQAEAEGRYADAAEYYLQAVEQDDNRAAFTAWVRCSQQAGMSNTQILQNVEAYLNDAELGNTAFWQRVALLSQLNRHGEAIQALDMFIDKAQTPSEAALGKMAQLSTYYEIAVSNMADGSMTVPRQYGKLSSVIPTSREDFKQKWNELREIASGNGGDVLGGTQDMPESYKLYNAYPNPFNPSTTIRFDMPEAGSIQLAVYDVMGRQVAKLIEGHRTAGTHSIAFDGTNVSSGVYFIRMNAPGYQATQKIVLIK